MSVICRRRFPTPRQRATARNKNKYFFSSIQIKQLKVLPTGKSTESKEMRIITTTFSHNEFKWRSQHSEQFPQTHTHTRTHLRNDTPRKIHQYKIIPKWVNFMQCARHRRLYHTIHNNAYKIVYCEHCRLHIYCFGLDARIIDINVAQ